MKPRPRHATQNSDVSSIPRPVYFRAYRLAEGALVQAHSHPWDQFIFARNGVMHVTLSGLNVVLPPQYGMWIPADTQHSVWAAGTVDLESLYVDHLTSRIAARRIVLVTSLVREFIHHGCQSIPVLYDEAGADGRKVEVLLGLIDELHAAPLDLPFPLSEAYAQMCTAIQNSPELKHGLEEWAARTNTSVRTFSRRFAKETGMTFHAWKQRLRLLQSLQMLQRAVPVTHIALSLGYSSTSAYGYSFKRLFGCTPREFYAAE
jgi:AraC-like DNA-binding protein